MRCEVCDDYFDAIRVDDTLKITRPPKYCSPVIYAKDPSIQDGSPIWQVRVKTIKIKRDIVVATVNLLLQMYYENDILYTE
jgi:hypothetical protein